MAEELWMRLGRRFSIVDRNWPVAKPELAREEELELAVQVNGRVRAKIVVSAGASEDEIRAAALAEPKVQEATAGKTLQKVVVVPGRLVSLVVK
jgi:leucyl-tRNA synthetase